MYQQSSNNSHHKYIKFAPYRSSDARTSQVLVGVSEWSALGPKADIQLSAINVPFEVKADISRRLGRLAP